MEDGLLLEHMELAASRVVEAQKQDIGHARIHHLLLVELIVVDHPKSLQRAIQILAVSY